MTQVVKWSVVQMVRVVPWTRWFERSVIKAVRVVPWTKRSWWSWGQVGPSGSLGKKVRVSPGQGGPSGPVDNVVHN